MPLGDPPEVLINRAEQLIKTFGYTDPVGDTASGFMQFSDLCVQVGWNTFAIHAT